MGKKSKRSNKKNGGQLRKGLAAVLPTAAAAPATTTTFETTICRLTVAHKYDEILKVESKYRHLDTFRDDPVEDVYILDAFGSAKYASWYRSKDDICCERAIHYYERAKESEGLKRK